MSVNSLSAAKRVCELRDWKATNLEIQKILYIAQMVYLGRSNGFRPLVDEQFQAWDYGPVLPSVYNKAKIFGDSPVKNVFLGYDNILNTPEAEVIKETSIMLSGKSPGQLVAITHWGDGAWARHYKPGTKNIKIPNSEILDEYRKRTAQG